MESGPNIEGNFKKKDLEKEINNTENIINPEVEAYLKDLISIEKEGVYGNPLDNLSQELYEVEKELEKDSIPSWKSDEAKDTLVKKHIAELINVNMDEEKENTFSILDIANKFDIPSDFLNDKFPDFKYRLDNKIDFLLENNKINSAKKIAVRFDASQEKINEINQMMEDNFISKLNDGSFFRARRNFKLTKFSDEFLTSEKYKNEVEKYIKTAENKKTELLNSKNEIESEYLELIDAEIEALKNPVGIYESGRFSNND